MKTLRIATRSSRLALWQARYVANLLRAAGRVEPELVKVSSSGDRNRTDSLTALGGTGVFTKAIQEAVLDRQADLAVHSLKDLPTEPTEGLMLAATPPRASRYDVLARSESAGNAASEAIEALPEDARVGTGSPRRKAQLLRARPDLQVLDIRGNIETRLRKLDQGHYEAIVLAEAGLDRLELRSRPIAPLTPPDFYPAVGQGALAVECRAGEEEALESLAAIDDAATRTEVTAERAALATLRAGCHAPLGVHCEREGGRLALTVALFSLDGRQCQLAQESGAANEAGRIGQSAAETILAAGGEALLGENR